MKFVKNGESKREISPGQSVERIHATDRRRLKFLQKREIETNLTILLSVTVRLKTMPHSPASSRGKTSLLLTAAIALASPHSSELSTGVMGVPVHKTNSPREYPAHENRNIHPNLLEHEKNPEPENTSTEHHNRYPEPSYLSFILWIFDM